MVSILSVKNLPMRKCVHYQSYQLWLLTHQSQIQLFLRIPIFKRVCGIYDTLKLCRRKRVYFCVVLGRIIPCLKTGFTLSFIIPPGSEFFYCRVSGSHPYSFELEFLWPGWMEASSLFVE